jgi:hypothetical protein
MVFKKMKLDYSDKDILEIFNTLDKDQSGQI